MSQEKELTPKQKRFVEEYVVDLNGTQAAIRAGFNAQTANVRGSQLLALDHVRAAIDEAIRERSIRAGITADRVLEELSRIAFSDVGNYVEYGPDGVRIKDSADVDTRALSEVSEVETKAGKNTKFKLYDKVAALDKLGRHLGLFNERVEVSGKGGGPVEIIIEGWRRPTDDE